MNARSVRSVASLSRKARSLGWRVLHASVILSMILPGLAVLPVQAAPAEPQEQTAAGGQVVEVIQGADEATPAPGSDLVPPLENEPYPAADLDRGDLDRFGQPGDQVATAQQHGLLFGQVVG